MDKKYKVIILTVIAIIIFVGGYFAYQKFMVKPKTSNKTTVVQNATLNPLSGQAIGDKLPKTNPFDVNVTPYDAYKNPFK